MDKYVVYNPDTKEYFKRGYGVTTDTKRARIYSRPGDARNSLNRKWYGREPGSAWGVYVVNVDFPMNGPEVAKFDTFKAVRDSTLLPFATVVGYFRQMYQIDITGNSGDTYPMSVDMIAAFYRTNPFLSKMGNGDRLMVHEGTFDKEMPLVMMLAGEIIKMFGTETQGRRVALFEVDWLDDEGQRREDY